MLAKSTQFFLNPNGNKTLTQMAKDEPIIIEDIEEGEISDSESVEEISEHDFFQEAGVSSANAVSRDWKRLSSNYANDLAMCGWIQGVQNKPLTEIFVREEPRSDDETNTVDQNGLRWNKVVDLSEDSGDEVEKPKEAEKEEGELEEGELLETETFEISEENVIGSSRESTQNSLEKETKEREFEKRVNSVQELLKTVTVKDAEKSFHGVCSQICVALETLRVMVSEDHVCVVDGLIQQTFSGIQSIRSVFFSGSLEQKDQCRDALSRLLSHVKDQNPALFSPGQMKEFEVMSKLLVADSSLKNVKKEREVPSINGSCISHDSNSSTASFWKLGTVNSDGGKSVRNGVESLKLEPQFGVKGRGDFGPSFNLHMNYDEDSLPSPTREGPPPLSLKKLLDAGEGVIKTRLETNKQEEATVDPALHPYVTDALRAVSSYQQKFGRTSFFTSDRLPSPTPSGDCDDGGGDSHEEVSSSTVGTVKTANSFAPLLPAVVTSGSHSGGGSTVLGPGLTKTTGILGPGSSPILKVPTKSRDPRLRYSNSEVGDIAAVDLNAQPISADNNASKKLLGGILGTRKHTFVEEPCTDGLSLKRQRNESTDSGVLRDPRLLTGRGGWLEDNSLGVQPKRDQLTQSMEIDARKLENGDVSSNKRLNTNADLNGPLSGTSNLSASGPAMPVVSLPSLLKDIAAVNPTMLMQLIQMEQQRLATGVKCISADPVQSTISPPTSNTPVPVSSGNVASTMASELVQRAEGKSQIPAQASSTNSKSELGKVRMKPRDPRRILQHNMVNKSQSLVSEQFKTGGVLLPTVLGLKDNITVRGSTEQATSVRGSTEQATSCSSSQSVPLPDIASQFTTKLKNIADLLSNPQLANTSVIPLQNFPQPLGNMGDEVDARAETISKELQSETDPTSDEGTVALPQPQNPWGDLEQLFEGYDDQQKAAIQKERSRRIEEQNKMFAARKLCLVLDLDHTLLNSAKFLEVDPVHDEILRKKEEIDREKPQRHLFRFQHMGMWTKLRPGVWSFLDKASKLFELHLYTMGNKLYATEMAKVLDPTGSLFSGRVISRGDDGDPFDGDERVPKSKDLDGVLGMESGVVIIDDSVRVWPHNKLNLILVERYTYFPCSRRQFGLPGPSLLEIDHDERPEDGTLASSFSVIERIHQNFFSHRSLNDVDVRNILASEQQKILTGCRIVFSRIFPVGEANPHLHPLWLTAEQFGAVCTNQIDDQVTHVVANSLGTDKVNWALSTGRFVVHPGWVEASALLYRRANERDFAVKV